MIEGRYELKNNFRPQSNWVYQIIMCENTLINLGSFFTSQNPGNWQKTLYPLYLRLFEHVLFFSGIWDYLHNTLLKKYASIYNGINVVTGPVFDYNYDGRYDTTEQIQQ